MDVVLRRRRRRKRRRTTRAALITPLMVPRPQAVLRGHQSIVNSLCWNGTLPLLATSGVERVIKACGTGHGDAWWAHGGAGRHRG